MQMTSTKTSYIYIFPLQSTPVGSIQTGHEVVVSPNRDRHTAANKVIFSQNRCAWRQKKEAPIGTNKPICKSKTRICRVSFSVYH